MASTLTDPVVPPGALILVPGINSHVGMYVADALLVRGYRVRGTFKYSRDDFALVEVAGTRAPGVWKDVVNGVSGIVAVQGTAGLDVTDVGKAVEEELGGYIGMLEAARTESSVKSIVITCSLWAAWTPTVSMPAKFDPNSWNEQALRRVEDPFLGAIERRVVRYMAVKTKVDKDLWAWVRREKPQYKFNTVHPDMAEGRIINTASHPDSRAGMVRWEWGPETFDVLADVPPQFFINVRDCALILQGALLAPRVDRQRILASAGRYSAPTVVAIMKYKYPGVTDFAGLPEAGWDRTDITDGTAKELLRAMGREEWSNAEKSISDSINSFRGP